MSETDDLRDLAAVRAAVSTVPRHELDESRARVRALLAVPRPAVVTWRTPVFAAVLVLAVVIGGAWALRGPSRPPVAAPPTLDVAAVFEQLAGAAAADRPVVPGPGRLLYVEEIGVTSDFRQHPPIKLLYRTERWFRPQGMVLIRQRLYEHHLNEPSRDSREDELARGDAGRSDSPRPSLVYPSPDWIAALPTTPEAMHPVLVEASSQVRGDWSVDHGIWEGMRAFLPGADPQLTPAVRAALYRTLAGLRGLTAHRIEIAGRPVVSVRMLDRGGIDELLFDERTGHFLGLGGGAAGSPLVTRAPLPVPDVPLEPTITTRTVFTCTVVGPEQVPA